MIHFSQKILFKKTPSLFSPFSFPASRNFFSSEEQKDLEDPSLQNENADSTVESPPPLETRKKRKKRKDKDPTPEELAESFNITTITAKDLEEELIYSIQQDSDTEYGSVPIFHELVEKEPSEKEILEGTKNRKSHSLYFPSDDQHNKFSYQKMLLYKIAEHIYTNESSIFYQKYMRRDIKTQMKMFPHTPEEQSFNLPFGFEDQIKYTKELLEKNKIYLEETVAFRMPDIGIEDEAENEETNELNKIKTYKSILGKEIYRLMKELEHNEKSKNCDKFTSNILDNVVNAFNDGTYDIISPRDFRFLITKKEFLQYSHVFFNQKFFQQNPNIIGDIDFEEILKNCIHDISFVKNLEVCYLFLVY